MSARENYLPGNLCLRQRSPPTDGWTDGVPLYFLSSEELAHSCPVRNAPSMAMFRCELKTVLCRSSFDDD